ncbi:IS66 family transposase zinc-finger binding domain-containing protein, partial [Glaciimonas sp. PCH181]|uniref:IS66 family transposase zinc-finger binding domain-containing protein n=1 Tax=Glaciimonas sp. PCH181 TaxID=2133943 RepID=UPI001CEC68B7
LRGMSTPPHLPDDISALKAMITDRDAVIALHGETVAQLQDALSSHRIEIEHLKLFIAKLKRLQFGRKSEKLDRQIEQLELRLEDLQTEESDVASAAPATKPVRPKIPRKPLPPHLPRDEKIYTPEHAACPDCGGDLRHLGSDVAEQLEFVPASFRVIRHVRPKLACTCCDCIVQAPAPSRPIARSGGARITRPYSGEQVR